MKDLEVSFITNKNGKKTHAIIPIEIYKQLTALKSLIKYSAPLSANELYTFSCQNVTAHGYPKGTRHKPFFLVTKDTQFQSASAAAAIIAGTVRNGLDVWTNREGFSLKESGFGKKTKKS